MADIRPRYVEAYPRLDLFAGGLSAWNGGEPPLPVVRYRIRTFHVGGVIIRARMQHVLVIDYHFPSLPYCRGRDQAEIKLIKTPNGVDDERQYMQCDGCGYGYSKLVFDQEWRCRRCLNLAYRSQRIGTGVRLTEELYRIEARLGNGRPKHMHQAKYRSDMERAAALRWQLGFKRPAASLDYTNIVEAEWLTIDQAGESPHHGFEIVSGRLVPVAT